MAAIESFEAALDRQPDYAAAWVGLADSWLLTPLYGAVPASRGDPEIAFGSGESTGARLHRVTCARSHRSNQDALRLGLGGGGVPSP